MNLKCIINNSIFYCTTLGIPPYNGKNVIIISNDIYFDKEAVIKAKTLDEQTLIGTKALLTP